MRHGISLGAAVTAALTLPLVGGLAAEAQESAASRPVLQEILVTARRTEESLQEVPLAISALTGEDIAARGLRDLIDVSAFTPGFYARYQASATAAGRNDRASASYIFRNFTIASGLVFVDGAPVTGGSTPEVYDVARIEVLKGPQSAYFGRSTFAGAVNFITREPGDEFRGRVSADMGTFNSSDISLSLEGPLFVENLAGRISGRYSKQGGHYTNAHDPGSRLGDRETTTVSGVLSFRPSDRLSMRAYASIDRYDDGPPAQMAIKSTEMNCNTGGTANGGMWWCGKLPNWDQVNPAWISANNIMDPLTVNAINNNAGNFPVSFNSRFQTKPGLRRDNIISNFRVDYETAGGYTISSLTSYNTEKSMNIVNLTFRNGDNVANPLAFLPNTAPFIKWMVATQSESDDFSQELRIVSPQDQRLRWLAGASFLELTNPGGTGVYGTTPFGRAVVSSTFRSRSSTPAIFGGIYYDITEALTFSGELRFQQDKIFRQALTGPPAVLIPGGGPRFNEKYNSLAPRATLDWKFATDQMVYLQYARGYRPGGFNPALAAQSPAVQALFPPGVGFSFEEDRLDNFELGLKSTWLAGRIQTRAAAYYAQWRDGQQNTSLTFVDPNTGVVNIVGAVQNIGEINLQGIELEGEIQATDNLVLAGTFGYNDSDIRVFVCGDCRIIGPSSDVTGNRLPNAPRTEWSASGTYTAQLVRDWESFLRLDYTHRGESYVTASNSAIIGSSDQVNLRVGLRRDTFTLQAYARNLLYDKAPLSASLGADALFTPTTIAGREVRYSLPDKRMFGISAAFEF